MMKMLECFFHSYRYSSIVLSVVCFFCSYSQTNYANALDKLSTDSKVFIFGTRLAHFGSVSEITTKMHAKKENVWEGHEALEPMLLNARVEWLEDQTLEEAKVWVEALQRLTFGTKISKPNAQEKNGWLKDAMKTVQAAWLPFRESDSKIIRECSRIPCSIKLNAQEVRLLSEVPPKKRIDVFYTQIQNRLQQYEKAELKSAYEFQGGLVEPWSFLQEQGFKVKSKVTKESDFWVRKIELDPKRLRTIRQILDRKFYLSYLSGGQIEASVWLRDVYSAHYFDGWAEVYWIRYFPDLKKTLVIMAHAIELDFYKQNDLVTRMARPRMKAAFFKESSNYLKQNSRQLKANVEALR